MTFHQLFPSLPPLFLLQSTYHLRAAASTTAGALRYNPCLHLGRATKLVHIFGFQTFELRGSPIFFFSFAQWYCVYRVRGLD
jgi:hypothetical protein